jgi:hypothetical protein
MKPKIKLIEAFVITFCIIIPAVVIIIIALWVLNA